MMKKLLVFAFLFLPVMAHASGAITLTATTDSLEVATSTTATTDYRCSFVDNTATTFTPGSSNGQITTATDTTIVAAPAASTQRKISGCSIHVVSGGAQTVTVMFDTSGTERTIFVASLTTGWSLQWNEEARFEIHDDAGRAVASTYDEDTVAAAAERVTMAGVVRDDTPASLVGADGDRTEMQVDGTGRLWVNGSGVTQPVSGTVTVTATDLDIRNLNATDDIVQARGAAADGAAVTGNPVLVAGQDGTNAQSIKTDSTGSLQVDIESSATIAVDTTSADQITALGSKSDNGGAPSSTNLGTLPGVALAADPTRTEGNQVALRTQLDGDLVTVMVDELPAGTQNIGDVDVASLPNEGQQTAANSISVTPDTDNDAIGATAAAVPGEAVYVAGTDGTNVTPFYVDPCEREVRTQYRVDIVTATTTEIAAAVASEFYYFCSIDLHTAAANNVIIVEDDTATNCPSPTAGVSSGGTTAAEGYNFAANGGRVVTNGNRWVMKTTTANRSICIITSAATQLSGVITYVSAP